MEGPESDKLKEWRPRVGGPESGRLSERPREWRLTEWEAQRLEAQRVGVQ